MRENTLSFFLPFRNRWVGWTTEERGSRGGGAYFDRYGADADDYVSVMELDNGKPVAYLCTGLESSLSCVYSTAVYCCRRLLLYLLLSTAAVSAAAAAAVCCCCCCCVCCSDRLLCTVLLLRYPLYNRHLGHQRHSVFGLRRGRRDPRTRGEERPRVDQRNRNRAARRQRGQQRPRD